MNNKLILIEKTNRIGSSGGIIGIFQCRCGNTKELQIYRVNKGHIQSCGCLIGDRNKERSTHNKSRTPEYETWHTMKERCLNENHKAYKLYGGRGITICDRWLKGFENFYEDMGNRPSSKYSLDRKNNEQGYNKENCRWATQKEQALNRRTNVVIEYNGKKQTMVEWSIELKMNYQTLRKRIFESKWTIEKAFTYPVRKQK